MSSALDAREHDTRPAPSASKRRRGVLLPVLFVLLGVGVLLYPVGATLWNNVVQTRVAREYDALLAQSPKADIDHELESARAYNRDRTTGPILDPWLARISPDNADYQAYLHELDAFPMMGRIEIPSIGVDLPILHGTAPSVLDKAVGHLYGSDLPIGGEGTHTVLTGHTGLSKATLFDNLVKVEKGQRFLLHVAGQTLAYRVVDIRTVLPDEADGLGHDGTRDLATLITCTPYGINSHRLLVTGERVPYEPQEDAATPAAASSLFQGWMLPFVAGAALTLLVLIVFAARERRRRRTDPVKEQDDARDRKDETAL